MHHVHGNAAYADLSSTERSRRDSAFDFFKYWMRFLFLAPIELLMNMLKYRGLVDAVRCYSNVAGSFAAWWYLNANVNASAGELDARVYQRDRELGIDVRELVAAHIRVPGRPQERL